jgi:hypothetical protein
MNNIQLEEDVDAAYDAARSSCDANEWLGYIDAKSSMERAYAVYRESYELYMKAYITVYKDEKHGFI